MEYLLPFSDEEWDAVKDYPGRLPEKYVLERIKEWDEEHKYNPDDYKSDVYEGPTVVVNPIKRTAIKVNITMPRHLNYGSFCKFASLKIYECHHWVVLIKKYQELAHSFADDQSFMTYSQTYIDYFKNLRDQTRFAFEKYNEARRDMRIYIYIYNLLNTYYYKRVKANPYILKNDIISDIFNGTKPSWFYDHTKMKDYEFMSIHEEQERWESDFTRAINTYADELKNFTDKLYRSHELGYFKRDANTGDIKDEYVAEYMNWYVENVSQNEQDIIERFKLITRHKQDNIFRIKIVVENGKVVPKVWYRFDKVATTADCGFCNDAFPELDKEGNEIIPEAKNKSNVEHKASDNLTHENCQEDDYVYIEVQKDDSDIGKLAEIAYNSVFNNSNISYYTSTVSETKSFIKYKYYYNKAKKYIKHCTYTHLGHNINNEYSYIVDPNAYLSYINVEYIEKYNVGPPGDCSSTSYTCSYHGPPGTYTSGKPPDIVLKRYIIDRSIIV